MSTKKCKDEKIEKKPLEDDPETIYRIYSVISYFVVLVIIGLPVWWFTTRVYRASLPINKMYDVNLPEQTDKILGIPLSLEYDVLISVVNPDPKKLKLNLNTKHIDQSLQPFLKQVESIANFTVKSQWLYLVELGVIPRKVMDHFVLYEEQLPHIITPLEKKLWSHLSPRPCINLVLYVSNCQAPLYIYSNSGKMLDTNAFISPGWGGIHIINANTTACENKLYTPDLQPIVSTFLTQLKQLLGITVSSENDLIELKRGKAKEMIDSARRTLKSLAQLLSEISSIVISDEVASKIEVAVQYASEAESFLNANDVTNGLKKAKIAYENAEGAFSDPSLLALLYFPDDQKYAVYIPLFLPVMIPVLMSLTTIRKWYLNNKMKLKTD